MLSHSEEIIFLEPIDQYFETKSKFESNDYLNNESNESLIKMNFEICDLLSEENDPSENESNDSADSKNIAAIKANSDQIGAIKELVAKYGDYKTAKNNQPADEVDNGSKAVVNQLGTMSARA